MASPSISHYRVMRRIVSIFETGLKGRKCEAFGDSVDVHLTERDIFIPDVSIVCRSDIIKEKGIFGAPELVVEIISRSTAKRDKGYKMELYGRCGVLEYWIVSVEARSIEIYIQIGGKLEFNSIHMLPHDFELEDMTPEEIEEITKFRLSIFEDIEIDLYQIFGEAT